MADLFANRSTIHSAWMAIAAQRGRPVTEAAREVSDVRKDVVRRLFRFFHYDNNEMEQIGTGQDTVSMMGRALFAAARRETDPRTALRVAVNHSGRSAMTGALAGAVVGARAGVAGLPPEWVEALDVGDLVQELADEAFWTFAHRNVYQQDFPEIWQERYPGW
ncbi:ADP-ribosylglycohydrolase family protein [Saccharopolyspora griseoalba]|uniref:ADP-ribosylglycohydrolase family protein n=1 Tax=Saccharopolyspora griseoalba TaxID=1431848 RepID=A0ABW2LIK8_9PSEU